LELRHTLDAALDGEHPRVLLDDDITWEAVGDYLQHGVRRLEVVAANDPRRAHHQPIDPVDRITSLFNDVRSEKVFGSLYHQAAAGKLSEEDRSLAALAKPSEATRNAWAGSLLRESLRAANPRDGGSPNVDAAEQLHQLARAIDTKPPIERQVTRDIVGALVRHMRGERLPSPEIDQLSRKAVQARDARMLGSDAETFSELVGTLQRATHQAAIKAVRSDDQLSGLHDLHDMAKLLSGVDTTAPSPMEVKRAVLEVKAEVDTIAEPERARARVVAAITTLGIGMGVVTLAQSPAAAATPPAPGSSIESPVTGLKIQNVALDESLPGAASAPVAAPLGQIETLDLGKPSATVPLAHLDPNQTVAPTGTGPTETLDLGRTNTSSTPVAAEAPLTIVPLDISKITNVPRPVVHAPLPKIHIPKTKPVTLEVNPPPPVLSAPVAPPAQTEQPQIVPLVVSSVNAPQEVLSTETQTDPTSAQDVYTNLVTSGASLDTRVAQLASALNAEGYQAMTTDTQDGATAQDPNVLQDTIMQQVATLEQQAAGNSKLTPDQLQAFRKNVDTALVLLDIPSYASKVDTADMIKGEPDYLNAVAQQKYNNPLTYDPDGTNADFLTAFNQFDGPTRDLVTQLLASAEASITTSDQQYAQLQKLSPDAAIKFKAAMDAAAAANQATPPPATEPTPAPPKAETPPKKDTPAPKHEKKPEPKATTPETGPQNGDQIALAKLVKFGIKEEYAQYYVTYAKQYGLNPYLLGAQGKQESGNQQNPGTSSAGALGISQFMPDTWTSVRDQLHTKFGNAFPADASPMQPKYAIWAQAFYMNGMRNAVKSMVNKQPGHDITTLMLRAYNGGANGLRKNNGNPLSTENRDYPIKILAIMNNIKGMHVTMPHKSANSKPNAPEQHKKASPKTIAHHTPYSEYILGVPKGGSGHAVPYVNQVADLHGVDNINGYDACGLASTYTIEQALKAVPQSISTLHEGLKQANAYSDTAGILNTANLLHYIKNNLNLKVDTIQWELGHDTDKSLLDKGEKLVSDNTMAKVRQALDQGKILLIHTGTKVSLAQGGDTQGHYYVMYGYNDDGYFVANVGNRADSPPKGHAFSHTIIETSIDGFYAIST